MALLKYLSSKLLSLIITLQNNQIRKGTIECKKNPRDLSYGHGEKEELGDDERERWKNGRKKVIHFKVKSTF